VGAKVHLLEVGAKAGSGKRGEKKAPWKGMALAKGAHNLLGNLPLFFDGKVPETDDLGLEGSLLLLELDLEGGHLLPYPLLLLTPLLLLLRGPLFMAVAVAVAPMAMRFFPSRGLCVGREVLGDNGLVGAGGMWKGGGGGGGEGDAGGGGGGEGDAGGAGGEGREGGLVAGGRGASGNGGEGVGIVAVQEGGKGGGAGARAGGKGRGEGSFEVGRH